MAQYTRKGTVGVRLVNRAAMARAMNVVVGNPFAGSCVSEVEGCPTVRSAVYGDGRLRDEAVSLVAQVRAYAVAGDPWRQGYQGSGKKR